MDLHKVERRLDAWLEPRLPQMLTMLETLVTMESCSHNGEDVDKVGEYLTGCLRDKGFATRRLEKVAVPDDEPWRVNMGHVFTAWNHEPGTGIILPGHMDTVFPKGTTGRWAFAVAQGRATGPGVADMKGGLVMNLFVVEALRDLGLLDFPVTLTFSPDEELGSVTCLPTLRGFIRNARAALSTEPTRGRNDIITRSKGSAHIRLHVEGKAAHSSMDYTSGTSATVELAHKILALHELVDLEREIIVNTGLVSGGVSAGTVAPHAEAGLHVSFARMEDGLPLLQEIRARATRPQVDGTRTRVSGDLRLPPLEPGEAHRQLFELAIQSGQLFGMELAPVYARWASEAGFFSAECKVPSLCGMGPLGGNYHSEDEYLEIDTLLPRCKLLALTLLQAGKTFC